MDLHKQLNKQILRYLPTEWEQDPALTSFVKAMDEAFHAFDRDKQLSEHAFRVSERDYLDIYDRLKREVDVRQRSIEKLKEAIRDMASENMEIFHTGHENLLDVVAYLQRLIENRNAAEEAMLQAKEEAEKARKEAERANEAKSEFLSVMSHEIRTPLNAVIGLGHILMRQDPRPDQVHNLEVLRTSADNLLALVNDVLDFSKIGAGKLELELMVFDLRKTVSDLCQGIEVKAHEKGNTLHWSMDDNIPDLLHGDQVRIMQVLNNLLSNAAKFTKNGNIILDIRSNGTSNGQCKLLVSVSDNGLGISQDKLELIFKPFSQASTSITREFGGSGLGLAITVQLLQLMNSSIQVSTELGKGSTFSFELSLGLPEDQEKNENEMGIYEQDLGHARILLVEDTPFNILYAKQLLEGWNAIVEVAENGKIAVDCVRNNFYDIVLMDLQMPVMDGYTAALSIREFDRLTPIVALTASVSVNIREKTRAAGMQDYVSKPFNPTDLYHKIRKRMERVSHGD